MVTPGLKVALVHKTLHHKRPYLFPLLDNQTVGPIGAAAEAAGCGEWQLIHANLHQHADQFDRLTKGFDRIATGVSDVSLSWLRLRLYGILVWMAVTGRRRTHDE